MNTYSTPLARHLALAASRDRSADRRARVTGYVPEETSIPLRAVIASAILRFFVERIRQRNAKQRASESRSQPTAAEVLEGAGKPSQPMLLFL